MVDYELQQREMHDKIASRYSAHATEEFYTAYKERFMLSPLTRGLDLAGAKVLEAMCGSGQASGHLLARKAQVTGLDISPEMVRLYRHRWPTCDAAVGSIHATPFADRSFDCVLAVAGLHHLHPRLSAAIDEIYRVLRPGGYFCFVEPHTGSLFDLARNLWYRVDGMIVKNEAAIDLNSLEKLNAGRFQFVSAEYWGNLAYLLVANSLFFRIPLRAKRLYSSALISLEVLLGRFAPFRHRRITSFVAAQWRKST
jgi:SAM-dependent methyltransferase